MISVRINRATVLKARQGVVDYANRRFRAAVYKMFDDALAVSIQYSGDFVSNWRIITQNDSLPAYERWKHKPAFLSDVGRMQPRHAGDPEAPAHALDKSVRKPFHYTDKVYFVNMTPLEFTDSTVTGPDGDTREIRPENIIGGYALVGSYLRRKYGLRSGT